MNYYFVKCGKKKLCKDYGWYIDFTNKYSTFDNKEIHYQDLKDPKFDNVREGFKNVPVSLYKDVYIEDKDSQLVKSVINVFMSSDFKKFNDKNIKDYTKKIKKEFPKAMKKYKLDKKYYENTEDGKKIIEAFGNDITTFTSDNYEKCDNKELFNKVALYLNNKNTLERVNFDKNKYIEYCLENLYQQGAFIKYNECGEPILDNDDMRDIQSWKLRVDFTGKYSHMVFITNPKIANYEYCNTIILDKEKVLIKEIEDKMVISKELSLEKAQEFKLDSKKGVVSESQDNISEKIQKQIAFDTYNEYESKNK